MKRIARDNFVKLSRAEHDTKHALVFAVQQRNLDFLDKKLIEISTPGNANYQQWLTYDEIGEITSNQQGAQEVLNWLEKHGAHVVWTTNHNDYIKAEAPISTWEMLLHAEFYEFHDQSRQTKKNNGLAKYLRADQYTMPAEIKSHLSAVFHTVQTPPEMRQRYHTAEEASSQQTNFRTDYTISKTNFRGSSNKATLGQGVVTVQFLNEYYHISNNTGSALLQQAVFETGEEHYSPNDLTQFQNTFGLPVQDAEAPFGYTTTDCVGNSCYEGNLDVQYIMGVAQQTTSVYWYQPDTTTSDPFVDWATDVANSTNPPLSNSISWGSIEQVIYMYNSPHDCVPTLCGSQWSAQ
jgi:tripeptidyl-peptidase-1